MISWRNPGDEHGHFDFDTYAAAILEARAAVAAITRQPRPSTSTPPARAASSPPALLGHLAASGGSTASRA